MEIDEPIFRKGGTDNYGQSLRLQQMKLGGRKLNGTGRTKTEFVWRIFARFTTIEIMEEIQKFMKSIQCEPEEFEGRIIFMSMFNEIEWRQDDAKCILNSIEVARYAHRFPRGHWSFLEPGLEKTWYKTCTEKPNNEWDGSAASMILQLNTESRHSVFRALDTREYGREATRLSDNDRNVELLLRTIKSVNQLSIYEFIADWSQNLDDKDSSEAPSADDSDSSGTLHAIQILGTRRLQKEDYNVSRECRQVYGRNEAVLYTNPPK